MYLVFWSHFAGMQSRDGRNNFYFPTPPPFTFRKFLGGSLARFWPQGVDCNVFGLEAPKNNAEGGVLENFCDFFVEIVS